MDNESQFPGTILVTEAEISAGLQEDLVRLGDRCIWHREVWMLCWTHSKRMQADRLRIDYVIELDGRLLGIEVKAPPPHMSDLGRYLVQCSQYAAGKIGANRSDIPQSWIGRPIEGVFLRTRTTGAHDMMMQHFRAAHRLYGPANVGFVTKERHTGLTLLLCGNRFWTESRGYNQGMLIKSSQVGSQKFNLS